MKVERVEVERTGRKLGKVTLITDDGTRIEPLVIGIEWRGSVEAIEAVTLTIHAAMVITEVTAA